MTTLLIAILSFAVIDQTPQPVKTQPNSGCDFRILLTNNTGEVYPWVVNLKITLEDTSDGKPFYSVEPKTGRIDICDAQFRVFRIRVEGLLGPDYILRGNFSNPTGRTQEIHLTYPGTVEEHAPPLLGCRYRYRLASEDGKSLPGQIAAESASGSAVMFSNEFGRIVHDVKVGTNGTSVFSAPGFEELRLPWSCERVQERVKTVILKAVAGKKQ